MSKPPRQVLEDILKSHTTQIEAGQQILHAKIFELSGRVDQMENSLREIDRDVKIILAYVRKLAGASTGELTFAVVKGPLD